MNLNNVGYLGHLNLLVGGGGWGWVCGCRGRGVKGVEVRGRGKERGKGCKWFLPTYDNLS